MGLFDKANKIFQQEIQELQADFQEGFQLANNVFEALKKGAKAGATEYKVKDLMAQLGYSRELAERYVEVDEKYSKLLEKAEKEGMSLDVAAERARSQLQGEIEQVKALREKEKEDTQE